LHYHKKTLSLIVIATVVRFVIAYCIGLGNDEVYYRMYAQYLQWNYFDHPPMVGWLIRLTTANLWLDSELFIRLGAIASAAITTWLMYLCGKKISTAHTGFLAAVLYTATIYGSIIAGTFILPDSPQMVFWAAGLYLLLGIADYTHINRVKKRKLLLFGVVAGLGMLCKIHTAFLWLGLLGYIVFHNRLWLKEPLLYLSGLITVAFFYPVVQWNIDHHFVTYLYHGNRVNIAGGGLNFGALGAFTAGQVFYTNPILFPYLVIATVAACRNRLPILASQKRILLFCSLPLIGLALAVAFFKEVLPHWAGPAYMGILLLTACWFGKLPAAKALRKPWMPKPIVIATAALLLVVAAGLPLIHFVPGTLGKKEIRQLGDGDFTLDLYGWKSLRSEFAQVVAQDIQAGLMKPDAPIVTNKWFPAAHIDYYVAMPLHKSLLAIGDTNDIHQYIWINQQRPALQMGDDAYCIVPSNNYVDVATLYAPHFTKILPPLTVVQKRNGVACRQFYIWRLKNYTGKSATKL
jgi:Dolichyl-phosphate-mannose-protein mannosyltransferase